MKGVRFEMRAWLILLFTCIVFGEARSVIVIDDFLPRDLNENRRLGGTNNFGVHSFVDSFAGNMLGLERDVQLEVLSSSPNSGVIVLAEHGFSDGQETFNLGLEGMPNNLGNHGRATLQWDGAGDEAGNTGIDKHLNNLGAGNALFSEPVLGFRVYFRSPVNVNSPSVKVGMILRADGFVLDDIWHPTVLEQGNYFVEFRFSQEHLLQTDSISLYVEAGGASNSQKKWIGLQRIETIVPEPSAAAGLAAGALFLGVARMRAR